MRHGFTWIVILSCNAGMPLLGNPTAAVLYPGKLVFAILPDAWAARIYVVVRSAPGFLRRACARWPLDPLLAGDGPLGSDTKDMIL